MIPGTAGPEQRVFPAARMAGVCRAHPVLVSVVAVLAITAAVATYINRVQLALVTMAGTSTIKPGIKPGSAGSVTKVRDIVIWRDEAGAIYRAKIGGGRFDEFLGRRKAVLEAARTESRDQAAVEILAALKPVFADMTARVPRYADWYFGYLTKYELMAHALVPALEYLPRSLNFSSRSEKSLVQVIGPHVVEYLEKQYAERVVRPREAEVRLRAAFDKSYGTLRAHWARIVDEQRGAIRAFIKEQAGAAERLSADQATGIELDWDGGPQRGSAMHEEGMVDQSFRRGLLSVRLKIPLSAKAPAQPDISEKTPEEADEVTHVIVKLFDKLIGPVVSQMSDLAIGIFGQRGLSRNDYGAARARRGRPGPGPP